jgi:hypothetical protein
MGRDKEDPPVPESLFRACEFVFRTYPEAAVFRRIGINGVRVAWRGTWAFLYGGLEGGFKI